MKLTTSHKTIIVIASITGLLIGLSGFDVKVTLFCSLVAVATVVVMYNKNKIKK